MCVMFVLCKAWFRFHLTVWERSVFHSFLIMFLCCLFELSHRKKFVTYFMLHHSRTFSQGSTSKVKNYKIMFLFSAFWLRDLIYIYTILYLLKSSFNDEFYRRGATWGEDEEAGVKVCSSSPGAPHWETWDPTGEALTDQNQVAHFICQ